MSLIEMRLRLADVPRLAVDLRRFVRYRRTVYREFEDAKHGVPPIECAGIIPALQRIHRRRFPDRDWPRQWPMEIRFDDNFDTLETLYLALICRVADPRAIFEIGTFEGRTANVMALHTAPDCRIVTLDLPPDAAAQTALPIEHGDTFWVRHAATPHGRKLGTLPDPADNAKIQTLHGDSATFDYSPYRGRMDMVFVDGAHSYEYVLSDVRNALTLLAPRGFILMHDLVTHTGVTFAAMVLRKDYEIFQVAQTSFGVLLP